ncbi:hypothetical protein ACW9HQ_40150 [Nocardia gipuzkoensis]
MNIREQQAATNKSADACRECVDQTQNMYATGGMGAQYDDVVRLLQRQGYDAGITDTGGGCLAIIAPLDSERDLLITSNAGPLDERDTLTGWGVGIMNKDGDLDDAKYREVNDRSPQALLASLKTFRSLYTNY